MIIRVTFSKFLNQSNQRRKVFTENASIEIQILNPPLVTLSRLLNDFFEKPQKLKNDIKHLKNNVCKN